MAFFTEGIAVLKTLVTAIGSGKTLTSYKVARNLLQIPSLQLKLVRKQNVFYLIFLKLRLPIPFLKMKRTPH